MINHLMRTYYTHALVLLLISIFLLTSCSKETIFVDDNEPPAVNNVPRIRIQHYINKLFIDLIGREATDTELNAEVQAMIDAELSKEHRSVLIQTLQTSTAFIEGDTSYSRAFHFNLYNLAKVHCLEGVSDATIASFGGGDGEGEAKAAAVINSWRDLQAGSININELFARMIDNGVYDEINMNSFNFVNASFDNLLWRFPSNSEFTAGFTMVEHSQSASLFGQSGQSKADYIQILTNSREMYEGLIIYVYQLLLSRRPESQEVEALLNDFINHKDIKRILQAVMVTDEYANFE